MKSIILPSSPSSLRQAPFTPFLRAGAAAAFLALSNASFGSITMGTDFRFIRADAIIDVEGDGVGEAWLVDAVSRPGPAFSNWSDSVSASVTVGANQISASSALASTFLITPESFTLDLSATLTFVEVLQSGARNYGSHEGFPRNSGPFLNVFFDFTSTDAFSFSGLMNRSNTNFQWGLQNLDTMVNIFGPNTSGTLAAGNYRFFTSGFNYGGTADLQFEVATIPEPAVSTSLASLAIGAVGIRRRRKGS